MFSEEKEISEKPTNLWVTFRLTPTMRKHHDADQRSWRQRIWKASFPGIICWWLCCQNREADWKRKYRDHPFQPTSSKPKTVKDVPVQNVKDVSALDKNRVCRGPRLCHTSMGRPSAEEHQKFFVPPLPGLSIFLEHLPTLPARARAIARACASRGGLNSWRAYGPDHCAWQSIQSQRAWRRFSTDCQNWNCKKNAGRWTTICLLSTGGHVRVNSSGSQKTCTWL